MKKGIVVLSIIVLGLVIFLSGCTEDNGGGNNSAEAKTVTMTAEEMTNDMTMDMTNGVTVGYESLDEGDTLIIQDTIGAIEYDSTADMTTIEFSYDAGNGGEGTVYFYFQGNITDSFSVGDEVKITNKIKQVEFTYQEMSYNMEMLEDYWENEEYFTSNMMGNPYKPLPVSNIEKI